MTYKIAPEKSRFHPHHCAMRNQTQSKRYGIGLQKDTYCIAKGILSRAKRYPFATLSKSAADSNFLLAVSYIDTSASTHALIAEITIYILSKNIMTESFGHKKVFDYICNNFPIHPSRKPCHIWNTGTLDT